MPCWTRCAYIPPRTASREAHEAEAAAAAEEADSCALLLPPFMSVGRALNEWSADAHGRLGVIHSSIHSHLPSHGISSWVNEIISYRVKPCVSSAPSNIIISCAACQLRRVSPDAQGDNLQARGIAEAHRSSPAAAPRGGFPSTQ